VWYRLPPDLGIVQSVFHYGLAIPAVGALGVTTFTSSRSSSVMVTFAGALLTAAGIWLVGTRVTDPCGETHVPLLGHTTTGHVVPFAFVCSADALAVCVHPAYGAELGQLSAFAKPVTRRILFFSPSLLRSMSQNDVSPLNRPKSDSSGLVSTIWISPEHN
jgi:hypothetical protein